MSSMCLSLGAEALASAVMIEFWDEVPQPTNRMGLVYLICRCQLNVVISNKYIYTNNKDGFQCLNLTMKTNYLAYCKTLTGLW